MDRPRIRPPLSLILDGENAWEYYPGNGRDFLRRFYARIQADPDIHPLTVTEAIDAAGEIPAIEGIFPGSWINANFDVWIGDPEDVRAWDMLRDARETYARAFGEVACPARRIAPRCNSPTPMNPFSPQKAAIGAGGTARSTAQPTTLNSTPSIASISPKSMPRSARMFPTISPHPIKRRAELARREDPSEYLQVKVDGRETSYFEWMGAGFYATDRQTSAMHGRLFVIGDFMYGFDDEHLFIRLDLFQERRQGTSRITKFASPSGTPASCASLCACASRTLKGITLEQGGLCFLHPEETVCKPRQEKSSRYPSSAASSNSKDAGLSCSALPSGKAACPVDVMPAEGYLEIPLGESASSWKSE